MVYDRVETVFVSTKENREDTLVYSTKLLDSDTRAKADSKLFLLPKLAARA
jgi:hypothetical protein